MLFLTWKPKYGDKQRKTKDEQEDRWKCGLGERHRVILALEKVMFFKDKHSFGLSQQQTFYGVRASRLGFRFISTHQLISHYSQLPGSFPSRLPFGHQTYCTCFYFYLSIPPRREERPDQIFLHQSGIRPSSLKVRMCVCLPMCAFVHVHVDASRPMDPQQHHQTDLKMNREGVVSQSINQQLIVINPTG